MRQQIKVPVRLGEQEHPAPMPSSRRAARYMKVTADHTGQTSAFLVAAGARNLPDDTLAGAALVIRWASGAG